MTSPIGRAPTLTESNPSTNLDRRRRFRYGFELCTHLVSREFKTRYRRSLFGWFWSVAQPLLRFVVLGFVFSKLLANKTSNYASYLFSGLIVWQWFASGVSSATRSALDHSSLLLRPGLPRWTIPLTAVLTDGLDLLAALPVLALVLELDGQGLSRWVLVVPVLLIVELALILGAGMLLCVGHVYFRDVGFVVEVLLLLGFYVTPVFYEASRFPKHLRWVIDWNPMSGLLRLNRDVLLGAHAPSWHVLIGVAVFAGCVLALGAAVFERTSGRFVDEL